MVNYSAIFPTGGGSANIAGFEWAEKTTDFTAEANKAYYCDTALGDILMELPSNPAPGDEVAFLLIGANKLNITTTDKIKGSALATDFVKQTGQQYLLFVLFYVDSTTGWNWDARYDSYIGNAYIGESDPLFANVVLFLLMEGQQGGTTFLDSSLMALTVSRIGSPAPTTTTSTFVGGTASGQFGASNSYLSINHANLALGTGAFTIEFWGYKTIVAGVNDGGFGFGINNANFAGVHFAIYDSKIYPFTVNNNSGVNFPINQWNHIALVREATAANKARCYLNGNLIWTGTVNNNYSETFCNVGCYSSSSYCWDGLIDLFRVTKGVARYSANFNPLTDTFLNL